ncbi:minor capsid protein [Klebsiella quasipneumoniae]|uniref:minor capsid protein n=1 Tax=Klebsiella TaxID=570 RepID=UPI0006663043|nr:MULTISPECIES: minor capsid protein [Klebsiella]QBL52309.1 hypothetical protein BMD99_028110 [Klebsiella sp. PO552]QLT68219.1 hypothetical protein HV202_31105 [Klebsiella oxytoca]HCI6031469.1 hypothetical protein [Klebsiella quasipneumoniae subsp. quasipneumoniae]MCX2317361.1 minor capsid protein [Klebsiella quasipneumoniae]MDK1925309.1 minor capsid protein [Klebsiella sp. K4-41]
MIVEQFATLLEKKGVGKVGKTIFANAMGAEVKSGVMVVTTGIEIDGDLHDFYQDNMIVVVRDASIGAAMKRADLIMAALPMWDEEEAGVRFRYVRPLNLPTLFPRNDASLFEVGISVEFAAHLL